MLIFYWITVYYTNFLRDILPKLKKEEAVKIVLAFYILVNVIFWSLFFYFKIGEKIVKEFSEIVTINPNW